MSSKLTFFVFFLAFAVVSNAATAITPVQPTLKSGCYQISSAAELYGFAAIVNGADGFARDSSACGKLTKDIVVNQNVLNSDGSLNEADTANFAKWTPIGPYYGEFDGQMHTISGLYYTNTGTNAGLFSAANSSSHMSAAAHISNVGVVGSFFSTSYSAGGLVGWISAQRDPVVIENCFNASRVEAKNNNAGGIVGTTSSSNKAWVKISNVYNTGTIVGANYIGGLIGNQASSRLLMVNAYNTGAIVGTSTTNYMKSVFGYSQNSAENIVENIFYLEPGRNEFAGTSVSEAELASGAVTQVMRHYDMDGVDGTVWGQNVGTDLLPTFSGSLTGATLQTIKMNVYHGSTKLKTKDMVVGYSYRIPNVDVDGYQFFGWYANSGLTGDTVVHTPTTLTADVSYWGRYEKRFDIAYNLDGGTIDSGLVTSYTETVGAVLPKKVSRSGYVFAGWYDNSGFTGNSIKVIDKTDSGDKTFYAKWFQIKKPAKVTDGCYLIATAQELYGFASIVNGTDGYTRERDACANLAGDIYVNQSVLKDDGTLRDPEAAKNYIPWNPIDSFAGVFNGNGFVISGLFYDDSSYYERFGLFAGIGGSEDKYAELKDFGLVDSYFAVKAGYFGTVVGQVIGAPLGNNYGSGFFAKVSGVYTESTLSPYMDAQGAAGLVGSVGYRSLIEIENSYNRGLVLRNSYNIAGILAHIASNTSLIISNCYSVWNSKNLMSRSSKAFVSGNFGASTVDISNCYYMGAQGYAEKAGTPANERQFNDGTVALALREGVNGSVWGQNVGTELYPVLSGKLENSAGAKYNVTFHTFAGDTATYFDFYIAGFKKALPANVAQENATFMGWYENAQYDGDSVTVIDSLATGDKEFWAKFFKESPVTFVTNGGTITSGNISIYTEGKGAALPNAVSRDSSIFIGWYDNEELSGTPVTEIAPSDTGSKTFYAAWFKLKMPKLDSTDRCFEITDAAELYGFAAYVNGTHEMYYNSKVPEACGKLANDIVVNTHVLNADGTLDSANVTSFMQWETINTFGGKFDGQGHTISGLYGQGSSFKGLFGNISEAYDGGELVPVTIKNLGVEDSYFGASNYMGGIVSNILGKRTSNRISYPGATLVMENCHFNGTIEDKGYNYIGGLVGLVTGSLVVSNSYSDGMLKSSSTVGGVVGYVEFMANISDCYNLASVSGSFAGGIVGYSAGTTSVSNCVNHGHVSGREYAGGLVGSSNSEISLLRSFNDGEVEGTFEYVTVAGLVAMLNGESVIANNYNLGKLVISFGNNGKIAGLVGVMYKTSSLLNNYNMGELVVAEGTSNNVKDYIIASAVKSAVVENNFYLEMADSLAASNYGTPAVNAKFKDGAVATALHDYVQKDSNDVAVEGGVTGSVWAQGDDYPILVTKDVFAVMLNTNGGTLANAPTSYKYGEGLTLPEPTRTGHTFLGWYANATFSGDVVTAISPRAAGDKIFYAKWEAKQYHVTAKVNNAKWGIVEGLNKSGIYSYGDEVYVQAVPDNGYKFSYWEDDVKNVNAGRTLIVTGDTTITAHFDPLDPESSSSVASSSSAEPPQSSSSVPASSSSSAKSSSSVKPASSSATSSSSAKAKSSSSSVKAKSSSSSAKARSSSSSKKGKSSDSKDALQAIAVAPLFDVEVISRDIHIAGAHVGGAYAVFDMHGKVMLNGTVDASNFALTVPRAGSFIVKMGSQSRIVTVR